MTDGYDNIRYEVEDPVALITLNRPARMNAWTSGMAREVRAAVRRAEADRSVVGVLITGAERAFCAGADLKDLDLKQLEDALPSDGGQHAGVAPKEGELAGPFDYLMACPKPVLAVINGPAAGMGAVLALWADLRFMAAEAFLTMSFSQRGTVAESGSSWLLPRLIGSAAALDLLVSSRRVAADEALQLGLVNRVVPGDELLDTAKQYVADLASSCSPASMATIKRQIYAELHDGLAGSVRSSTALLAAAIKGGDIEEGWQAYLEKRPPRFTRLGRDD